METRTIKIESNSPQDIIKSGKLNQAVRLIQSGEVIGFPTETVYGLGASCFSEKAVQSLFRIKGRPQDNPIILHVSNMNMLKRVAEGIPSYVKDLAQCFWPGPLTILFRKSSSVLDVVTSGLKTVAVRMPSHPVALALIEQSGVPIAAPSANLSGFPSPTTANHVLHDLGGKIPMIIDGGRCDVGVESTVIDLHQKPPVILRPGGISLEDLQMHLPNVQVYQKLKTSRELEEKPSSPGMKYRHYSPEAKVVLIEGSIDFIRRTLEKRVNTLKKTSSHLGIIHTHSDLDLRKVVPSSSILLAEPKGFMVHVISLIAENNSHQNKVVARGLFSSLREMDEVGVDIVFVEGIKEAGRGLAVMNRLRKAASEIIKEKTVEKNRLKKV